MTTVRINVDLDEISPKDLAKAGYVNSEFVRKAIELANSGLARLEGAKPDVQDAKEMLAQTLSALAAALKDTRKPVTNADLAYLRWKENNVTEAVAS